MVLGGSEDVSGLSRSEEEVRMQSVFMKAWAAFARDPRGGLGRELGWPEVGEGKGLVRLGFEGRGEATFVGAGEFDGVCANVTVVG